MRPRRTAAASALGAATAALAGATALAPAAQAAPAADGRALVTALARGVHYDWVKLGYAVRVAPARPGLLGLTDERTRTITLFLRPGETRAQATKVLAFELGHAVDAAYGTAASRAAWLRARHARPGTTWFAPDLAPEDGYGSGDFADAFSAWVTGSPAWSSRVAGRPATAAAWRALAPAFHRGQPLPRPPAPVPVTPAAAPPADATPPAAALPDPPPLDLLPLDPPPAVPAPDPTPAPDPAPAPTPLPDTPPPGAGPGGSGWCWFGPVPFRCG